MRSARHELRQAVVLLVVLPLALAACGGGTTASSPPSQLEGIPATGLRAPSFALHDQHGQLVTLSAQRGRYVILTFLYVHCPNVCPIIAGQLNDALHELGPGREDVRVLAVSVDPRGDTPSAVRRFIAVHRLLPEFLYLTGTAAELEPVWHDYHVASTTTKAGGVLGHTAISILLDTRGRPRAIFDSHVTAAEVVHDLHELEAGTPGAG